ncbi:MAG: putative lipoprotein [Rhodoferax sp.]
MKRNSFGCVGGLLAPVLIPFLAGCSSLLPQGRNKSSPFKSFDEARSATETLVPGQSNVAALTRLGIDPVQ